MKVWLEMFFALDGFSLVSIAWLTYMASIPKEKVAKKPVVHILLMLMSMLSASISIGSALFQGQIPSVLWGAVNLSTIGLAVFFLYLLNQAPIPDTEIAIKVGDDFPSLSAQGSNGAWVDSDDWSGKRVLFKFFRGHW